MTDKPIPLDDLLANWSDHYSINPAARDALLSLLATRLAQQPARGATHCENCGCDWLDNGLNPVGCPYCPQAAIDGLPINDAVPAPTQIQPGNLFLWNWTAMQKYGRACIAFAQQSSFAPTEGGWLAADDVRRLVREIDVAMNGEAGAAKQASLCDIAGQVKRHARLHGPVFQQPARGGEVWEGLGNVVMDGDSYVVFQRASDGLQLFAHKNFHRQATEALAQPRTEQPTCNVPAAISSGPDDRLGWIAPNYARGWNDCRVAVLENGGMPLPHDKSEKPTAEPYFAGVHPTLGEPAQVAEREFFARDFYEEARAGAKPWPGQQPATCTCPSGDGSLRWPCPTHPPAADAGTDQQPVAECTKCGGRKPIEGPPCDLCGGKQPAAEGRGEVGRVEMHGRCKKVRLTDASVPVGTKLYAATPPRADAALAEEMPETLRWKLDNTQRVTGVFGLDNTEYQWLKNVVAALAAAINQGDRS